MINIFYITLQTLFTYFIGRTFYFYLSKVSKQNFKEDKIFKIKANNFYLLFGLFIVGNIAVIINFFDGINQIYFYLILLFIALLNFRNINFRNISFVDIFIKLTVYGTFIISTYNAGLSKDADIYHLNNQLFIRDESIIFGLSNLHHRYGFSSLWEYIGASYWINQNFVFLQTPSLLIFMSFYFILFSFLTSRYSYLKKISLIILFFGILDNFGLNGGRNGFIAIDEVGAFDNTFGLLFTFSIIFLLILKLDDSPKNIDYLVAGLLILLSGQVRYLGFVLLIPYLIIIYKSKLNKYYLRSFFSFGFIISFFWFTKNLIISSCLIFPINITCISTLKWHQESQAIVVNKAIRGHPRNPNDIFASLNNYDWLRDSWLSNNYDYLLNFLFSLLIIKFLFFLKPNIDSLKYLSLSVVVFTVWIIFTPAYRFATPIFITILLLLNLDFIESSKDLKIIFINKTVFLSLFFVCLILTVRIDSYRAFISTPFNSHIVSPSTIDYEVRDNFYGLKPKEGKVCFLKKDCFPDEYQVKVDQYLNYKIIVPESPDYWNDFLLNIENKNSI